MTAKNLFGSEIKVGDVIAYPVKNYFKIITRIGVVRGVHPNGIQVITVHDASLHANHDRCRQSKAFVCRTDRVVPIDVKSISRDTAVNKRVVELHFALQP